MPGAEPLLRLQDVQVRYETGERDARAALQGVDFQIHAGDRIGLMGRAGSGKTTLLHVCARLLAVGTGTARWTQQKLPSLVFQFPERQLFAETVAEDVAYGLRQSGVPVSEVGDRVEQALEDVGLPAAAFGPRAPFHLSAGEMRRVALAGALAQRRGLVLLDEPTLGLDAEGVARLASILAGLHERRVAYCLASHDADFVAATCTKLVVLDAGRVVFQGDADDFWRDAALVDSCGVRLPREAALAQTLQRCGVQGLPPRPDIRFLAGALLALWHKPGAQT